MREGFNPSVERPHEYKKPAEQRDPAELLFDDITTDVRRRRKAGEDITFKTHERYAEWRALRDKNVAESQRAKSTADELAFRTAEEAETRAVMDKFYPKSISKEEPTKPAYRELPEEQLEEVPAESFLEVAEPATVTTETIQPPELPVDYLVAESKRVDTLRAQIEGGDEVESAVDQIEQLSQQFLQKWEQLNVLRDQYVATPWYRLLKTAGLERQIDGLQKEASKILQDLERLGVVFDGKEEGKAVERSLNDLLLGFRDYVAEAMPNRKRQLALATGALTIALLATCDSYRKDLEKEPLTEKPAAVKMADGDFVAETTISKVDSYKVEAKAAYSSAESKIGANEEVFALTEDEAKSVRNFTDWRRAILKPEFVGELQKSGAIPTTEKGLHIKSGTKVEVMVKGKVVVSGEVGNKKEGKDGGSIWAVLEKLKPDIKKVSTEEGGYGNLNLRITYPFETAGEAKKIEKHAVPVQKKATGQGRQGEVRPKTGRAVELAKAGTETTDQELESAEIKTAAKDFLQANKAKHQISKDYASVDDYEAAIKELNHLADGIEIPPAVDMKQSPEGEKMMKVKNGLSAEIGRLEQARNDLRTRQLQEQIGKESKVKTYGGETIKLEAKVKVSDLASDADCALRATGGMYGKNLAVAHDLVRAVAEFSSQAQTDKAIKGFLSQAEKAVRLYNLILNTKSDGRFKPNTFTLNQAKIGLELAKEQVSDLKDSLPETDLKSLIDGVKNGMDQLVERTKYLTGNAALFGRDGLMERLQQIVENAYSTGKLSNADKKVLKQIDRDLHALLTSPNNTQSDKDIANEMVDIVKNVKRGVSAKDLQSADGSASEGRLSPRYPTPKLPNS